MIRSYKNKHPEIAEDVYISSNATVIGDVTLEKGSSVWFHTVIRGDKDHIHIGEDSNIQDNCTLHTDPHHLLTIGKRVSVGHNAVLHGCTVEDESLIGMGAIVLNGAHIGKHCLIAAGALVKEGQVIPDNSLAVGCPAKVIRTLQDKQQNDIVENAKHYAELAKEYKEIDGSQ